MAPKLKGMSEFLEKTIDSLQCFNCKAIPGPSDEERNRYSCINKSHQLCKQCKELCACGSLVTEHPNPIVLDILKNLPMYCSHYSSGWRKIFDQVGNLNDHQINCFHRPVFCPALYCQFKIAYKNIARHLNKNHLKDFERSTQESNIVYQKNMMCTLSLPGDIVNGNTLMPRKLELIDGVQLFLTGKATKDFLHIWIYMLESALEAKKYAYNISFILI